MKVNQIKSKVATKVAKGKAKVAKKCGRAGKKCAGAVVLAAMLAFLAGCQNPAQRAQTADCRIIIHGGTVTFGNDFQSLAQSNETGGNDAGLTASPTTDVKPEVAVGVGGSSAGVGGTSGASKQGVGAAVSAAVDALADVASSGDAKTESDAAPAARSVVAPSQQCEGGACAEAPGDCPDGVCGE